MLSQRTYKAATAHLARWEPLRPLSERALYSWAVEQRQTYGMPNGTCNTKVIVWMSMECARLKSYPTPDEQRPSPPPEEAIFAWNWNKLQKLRAEEARQNKLEAEKEEAKSKQSTAAPYALRKLPLFKSDGMAAKCAPAPAVASGAGDPVNVSSIDGSLSFYRADHDESKCDFCRVMAEVDN